MKLSVSPTLTTMLPGRGVTGIQEELAKTCKLGNEVESNVESRRLCVPYSLLGPQ